MTHTACCPEGQKAFEFVNRMQQGTCTGYNCPAHGWQWVGEAPRCVCPGEKGPRCPERANGPDGLCGPCRDNGH